MACPLRCVAGLLVSAGLLGACSPLVQTPAGFVSLESDNRGEYDYRAVTADGLVIAAQELDHSPAGDLAFWVRAMENELRARNGYALLEAKDVTTKSGVAGKLLRFGHDQEREPFLYSVAIFVTEDHLYVFEAGGKKELFEEHQAQIEAAMSSLRTD